MRAAVVYVLSLLGAEACDGGAGRGGGAPASAAGCAEAQCVLDHLFDPVGFARVLHHMLSLRENDCESDKF